MKNIFTSLLLVITFGAQALAVTAPYTIPNDTVAIGKTGTGGNKTIEAVLTKAGASTNPKQRYNPTTGSWEFSNDGVNFVSIGSGGSAGNIFPNGGFETSTSGWTASGGTLSTSTTAADIFEGKAAGTWDSSAAAQTLTYATQAINGLAGTNGEVTCMIRVPSGTATHTMGIWDGTNLTFTRTIANAVSNTSYVATTINFIFPASGSISPRFTSVASNEPLIDIDGCYGGAARNIGTVAQAQLLGTITVTGCASAWTTAATTLGDFGTQTGCSYTATGAASAPATNLPAITLSGFGAGDIAIQAEGTLSQTTASKNAYFQFSDGIHTAREISQINGSAAGATATGINQSIAYSAPQSSVTIALKGKTDSGGGADIYGTTAQPLVIKVWFFPSSSQQAITNIQQDYDWTNFTGTFSAGFGTPSAQNCFHKRKGSDLSVRCTLTPGTVATSLGTLDLPNALALDGTKVPNNSTSGAGQKVGSFSQNATGSTGPIVTAYGTSTTKVYLGGIQTGATMLTPSNVSGNYTSSVASSLEFTVPISGWASTNGAPILIGSVTSRTPGAMELDSIAFSGGSMSTSCTTSPCNIFTLQGSTWVTSVTRAGQGDYVVNVPAGVFSTVPSCVCNAANATGSVAVAFCRYDMGTSTTTQLMVFTGNTTGSLNDSSVTMNCIGAR